ncbi:TSUP family transporter [Fodinibacter luteus]|uniref:TSUP family transporter n=1 Tax=Fodinibacter luteus TaxID=552064 RepID=UPI0031EA9AA5
MPEPTVAVPVRRSPVAAFAGGAAVGLLGGLVGLGGAEFRLPLLIGTFGFAALAAVIVNKAMSLVVVIAAIPARLGAVPLADVMAHWPAVVNLLAGSLLGAWVGASWAIRMASATLYRVLAALLVLIAPGGQKAELGHVFASVLVGRARSRRASRRVALWQVKASPWRGPRSARTTADS